MTTSATASAAPRKLTVKAVVTHEETGKRMCPYVSKIYIVLDDGDYNNRKLLAERNVPLGGKYNEVQAMQDFKKNRKLYKLTFEGNKHRGILKPFGF